MKAECGVSGGSAKKLPAGIAGGGVTFSAVPPIPRLNVPEMPAGSGGYVDVGGGNSTWWNAATGTCVSIHVSNGRYARIDTLKPENCGQE